MRFLKNNRGDTIVEVLISISVLSLILTASYALANRSSQGVRQAQERSEALKLSEALLEKLKSQLANRVVPDAAALANCLGSCKAGTENRYVSTMQKDPTGATYTVATSWDTVRGTTDRFQLVYRVYPADAVNVIDANDVPPPEDVCVNIAGAQTTFPSGYYDPDGDRICTPVPPPIYYCGNIPGSTGLPAGMRRLPDTPGGTCSPIPFIWIGNWDTSIFNFSSLLFPGLADNLSCSPRLNDPSTFISCQYRYTSGGFMSVPTVVNWSAPEVLTYDLTKNIYGTVPDPLSFQYPALSEPRIPAGNATLGMTWVNDGGVAPPNGYRPQVEIRINRSSGGSYNPCPLSYCLLSNYSSFNYMQDNFPINIPADATTLTIKWINDQYGGGYDANVSFPNPVISRH